MVEYCLLLLSPCFCKRVGGCTGLHSSTFVSLFWEREEEGREVWGCLLVLEM